MSDNKLFTIHDRMNELIQEITYKCARMFPEHFDELCTQLFAGQDVVGDPEIVEWITEYRHLDAEMRKENPWMDLLDNNDKE